MTTYRSREHLTAHIEELGRDVHVDPRQDLDDQFPEDAAIIAALAPRGLVRAVNVEQATAAPGESRSVRRKPVA